MKRTTWTRWASAAVAVATAIGGCTSGGQTGSETHWYSLCSHDANCSAPLRCLCGKCTKPCTTSTSCGSVPSTCVHPSEPAFEALCGHFETPAQSICAARCSADMKCNAGSTCKSGVCVVDAPAAPAGNPKDAGAKPSVPDASAGGDGTVTGQRDGRVDAAPDGSGPSTGMTDAGSDGAAAWDSGCTREVSPLGTTRLIKGPSITWLNDSSGIYFGSPDPNGSGAIVRRLRPNGDLDAPVGDSRVAIEGGGAIGFLYLTGSNDLKWFSPSEDRVVASWSMNDANPIIPGYLGDRMFGWESVPGIDGGFFVRVGRVQPPGDGGAPRLVDAFAAAPSPRSDWTTGRMVADSTTLYYLLADTLYQVVGTGQPEAVATVTGFVYGLELTANELVISRSASPRYEIFTIDRTTKAERQIVAEFGMTIRVLGDHVYYTAPDDAEGQTCTALRRVPIVGGAPETLVVTGNLLTFAFGQGELVWGTRRGLFKMPL